MKNKTNYYMALLVLLLAVNFSSAQTITGVFSAVGDKSTNSTQHLSFTIGESLIGFSNNSSTNSYSGFWYTYIESITTNVEDQLTVPIEYRLEQNYPNPFNPSTTISWQSPVSSWQSIKVFDVLGNEVATIVDEYREAGRHRITFDASQLSSGVYFYKIQAGRFTSTKKMLLIK